MVKYNHKKIEGKWQKEWERQKLHSPNLDKAKKPFYNLMMFPYPSAEGLHVGNVYAFVHSDCFGRYMRLKGFDVFEPIGLDGFGIHSENYAIKIKEHISDVSKRTEKKFYQQLKMIGNQYDWQRRLETYKPEYYKWTQWIFAQMFKKGLAYRAKSYINWCPSCKTVLSDEQVIAGKCERCASLAGKKLMEQWFFNISDYAERLLKNLDCLPAGALGSNIKITEEMAKAGINWSERTKIAQKNWIGKSEGAIVKFSIFNFQFSNKKSLKTKYEKILLATNNLSKKERVKKLLASAGLKSEILLPKDLGIKEFSAKESGDLYENAREKAEFYRDKTDLPILGIDTGFFIKGEVIDPVKVKRNALEGKSENEFTQEEIAQRLVKYYKNIAIKNGGEIEAYWQDILVLSLPDGKIEMAEDKREVILTDKVTGKVDIYFPVRSLYKTKITGKYTAEENEQEHLLGLKPFTDSLINLIANQSIRNSFEVFTTRLDTIFGCTYCVLAPEHKIIQGIKSQIENWNMVEKYIMQAHKKSEIERMNLTKEKTGVHLEGIKAINPFNNKEIPIFVADYVLGDIGTGAIMAVPAHDQRDFEFAKKYNLPIKMVICPNYPEPICPILDKAYEDDGYLVASGEFSGLPSEKAREKMAKWLEKNNLGGKKINYKLRDWCVSRQRYWGPPIPLVFCENCAVKIKNQKSKIKIKEKFSKGELENPGWFAVSEKDLPILLPKTKDYLPAGDGLSPLARNEKFWKTTCPRCGGPAKRETDVSDTFLDSAWYFFRYPSNEFKNKIFDKNRTKKWCPVDMYIGGQEHAVLHLLYSRFITMFFNDLGLIDFEEPYKRFFAHGLLIKEGAKMSKSRGNIVNPDEYIKKYGADAIRMYLMFLGDVAHGGDWRDSGIIGMSRFIGKIWNLFQNKDKDGGGVKDLSFIDKTIKKLGGDLEWLSFNTAIAKIMEYVNWYKRKEDDFSKKERKIFFEKLCLLLAPFAPHLAEELWSQLENKKSVHREKWPSYNPQEILEEFFELVVQINGKVRSKIQCKKGIKEDKVKNLALKDGRVKKFIDGQNLKKTIFVPNRLINFVI